MCDIVTEGLTWGSQSFGGALPEEWAVTLHAVGGFLSPQTEEKGDSLGSAR